jgi:predicted double-glycine peptidase
MKKLSCVALLLASFLLAAFTNQGAVLTLPKKLIPVPLISQKKDFSCGDVSTLAILRYWNFTKWKSTPEKALYKPLKTSSKSGTDPSPMAAFLSKEPGLKAEFKDTIPSVADLEGAVDRGEPAIVNIQAWQDVPRAKDLKPWAPDWVDGHYVVLVGYDKDNLYFMDPSTPGHYTYIPRSQFPDRWHDIVGAKNVHTQHIVIFVRSNGTLTPVKPTKPLPPKVTIIN